jgi:hypothetical protein
MDSIRFFNQPRQLLFMKGSFPGMNTWLWLVLTIIVCAIAIFWATSKIGVVDFPSLFG